MQENIIKTWYPIIKKLDTTFSLTEEQRIIFCNFCHDVSHDSVKNANKINDLENSMVFHVLPVMIKVLYDVTTELNKTGIVLKFSNAEEPEPLVTFADNSVNVQSQSTFTRKFSRISIDKKTHESIIGKIGIDLVCLAESALIKQTVSDLVKLATDNGELTINTHGIAIEIINEPSLSSAYVLTYNIK